MAGVVGDKAARGGISEVQDVRRELGAIWQAYGCLIPAIISGSDVATIQLTTKVDNSVLALKKAQAGTFKEGSREYTQALAVTRALMSEIASEIQKATTNKAVLIT